jgi:hypothetical protein
VPKIHSEKSAKNQPRIRAKLNTFATGENFGGVDENFMADARASRQLAQPRHRPTHHPITDRRRPLTETSDVLV